MASQSVLLQLGPEKLALGELSTNSLTGDSALSEELLSAFDFETDDGAPGPAKVLPRVLGILGAIGEHADEVKPGVRRELLSVGLLGDAAPGDAQPGELGMHYTSSLLTMQTATCYTEAGQPNRAAELYEKWLSGNSFSRRDYGYFLSLKANSPALTGEPNKAATVSLEAFSLARDTNSQRTVRELAKLLTTLKPWARHVAVCELREAVLSQWAIQLRHQP